VQEINHLKVELVGVLLLKSSEVGSFFTKSLLKLSWVIATYHFWFLRQIFKWRIYQ